MFTILNSSYICKSVNEVQQMENNEYKDKRNDSNPTFVVRYSCCKIKKNGSSPMGTGSVNAIKLRDIVGWVGAIPCGCPRNIVMGRPTHLCYKFTPGSSFQRFGGCSEAKPTRQYLL